MGNTRWLRLGLLMAGLFATQPALGASPVGKTFRTLTIGFSTYTNVTITDVASGSIFLRHARGFESLRIDSLSPEVQQQLGVQAQDRARHKPSAPAAAAPASTWPPMAKSNPAPPASPQELLKERMAAISGQGLSNRQLLAALALPMAGLAIMVVGSIWLIVAGFRVSVGWGVCCLLGTFLCGLLNLIFVFSNWGEAKKPFLCYLGGLVLCVASAVVVPNMIRSSQAAGSANSEEAVRARTP